MSDTITMVLSADSAVPQPFAALWRYWLETRGDDWAPAWPKFELMRLDSRLLPWTVLVDVEDDPPDFFYRFWGTERANLIGMEMTRKRLSQIPGAYMREANRREYSSICKGKVPVLCDTPVTTASGRHAVFQSVRLPLSDGGDRVGHILSAVNYEQISNPHYEYFGTPPKLR